MPGRSDIPRQLAAALLAANKHTCCICNEPRRHVQIHHIDGDPTKSHDPANLTVLCLDCHSQVTGDQGLGRSYSPEEVSRYKQRWEKRCADVGSEDNIEKPLYSAYEVTRVPAGQHKPYDFRLEENMELVVAVSSNRYIDVSLCARLDYERWVDERDDLKEFEGAVEVRGWECTFETPRTGMYFLVVINEGEGAAEVEVEASVWEKS
jgi:hypothetical protein